LFINTERRKYMKKLVAIIVAVVLVVGMAIPALAQVTEVQVTAGGGGPPVVKCKWETPDDGDTGPGTQILPSGMFEVDKTVEFWAVVTDPEGVGTVANVYADVWHPTGPPENGSFKYQLSMPKQPKPASIVSFQDAYDAGLVVFAAGHTYETVMHQLEQSLCDVYMGSQVLSYHQPAGDYLVAVKAYDNVGNPSVTLDNYFTYVPTAAIELDFTSVNYGSVQLSSNKWIGGDLEFGTPAQTVRNVGNTDVQITVMQDDMGFGLTSGVWNVEFDARLGADGVHAVYDPDQEVTLVDVLPLCNTQKLDFSIHVIKADPGTYTGTITIGCLESPFGP
jgi:hypothetical protein